MEIFLLLEDAIAKTDIYSLVSSQFAARQGDWGESAGDRLLLTEYTALCWTSCEVDADVGFIARTNLLIQIAMTEQYLQGFRQAISIVLLLLENYRCDAALVDEAMEIILLRLSGDLILNSTQFRSFEFQQTLDLFLGDYQFEAMR